MNEDQQRITEQSSQQSSTSYGSGPRSAPNSSSITVGTTIQLALVASLIVTLASVAYFGVRFVTDAVKSEEIARIAEVKDQETQRKADMERMHSEIERVRADLDRHRELIGHPGVMTLLEKVASDLRTEKAERGGVDDVSRQQRDESDRRIHEIEDLDRWFMQTRIDIMANIAKLQESQRLLESHCMKKPEP